MTLNEYTKFLQGFNPNCLLPYGLDNPYGHYEDLVFEIVDGVTIGHMLDVAFECYGTTFGKHTMTGLSDVRVGPRGGMVLSDLALFYILTIPLEEGIHAIRR